MNADERPDELPKPVCVLHIVAAPGAAARSAAVAGAGDRVLLIGDGVLAWKTLAGGAARLGVLETDADERGVTLPDECAARLTYADFVDWVAACDHSVTWT